MKNTLFTTAVALSLLMSACTKDQRQAPANDVNAGGETLSLADLNSFNSPQGQKDLADGLVGYYPFIGNANDSSGNGNNGTLRDFYTGGENTLSPPILTNDKFGYSNSAYYFNGISDFITLPHNPLLVGTPINEGIGAPVNQFSIYVRFKSDTSGAIQTLVQSGDGHASVYSAQLVINPDQSIAFNWSFIIIPSGSSANLTTAANIIQPNKWYDLILNYSNSQFTLYLNGRQVAINNSNPNSDFTTAGFLDNLRIGTTLGSFPDEFFKGTIDNVRFYNRELSRKEALFLLIDRKLK
ncbi:MAG TPA: LamG domain-containing protein [Mucilaginibacter sp.]